MESVADLGTRYTVLRSKYLELEQKCEAAVKENENMRAVLDMQLAERQDKKVMSSKAVQCDLADYAVHRAIDSLRDSSIDHTPSNPSRSPRDSEILSPLPGIPVSEVFSTIIAELILEGKRLLDALSAPSTSSKTPAEPPARTSETLSTFSLYLEHLRQSPDFVCDCTCVYGDPKELGTKSKGGSGKKLFVGNLFAFRDHIEFLTPATNLAREWNITLLPMDELVSLEQRSILIPGLTQENKHFIVCAWESQGQTGSPKCHYFWDCEDCGALKGLAIALKEQLTIRHIGENSSEMIYSGDPDLRGVFVTENQRKVVGWSSSYLMSGDPPAFFLEETKTDIKDVPTITYPSPPDGYQWTSEKWVIHGPLSLVRVSEVNVGSPAAFCGILVGDFIMKYKSLAHSQSSQFQPSLSAFIHALQMTKTHPIELVLYRPSTDSWLNVYLRPFPWKGKSFGFKIERNEGWEYAKTFAGPWSDINKGASVRRRQWVRYAYPKGKEPPLPVIPNSPSATRASSASIFSWMDAPGSVFSATADNLKMLVSKVSSGRDRMVSEDFFSPPAVSPPFEEPTVPRVDEEPK